MRFAVWFLCIPESLDFLLDPWDLRCKRSFKSTSSLKLRHRVVPNSLSPSTLRANRKQRTGRKRKWTLKGGRYCWWFRNPGFTSWRLVLSPTIYQVFFLNICLHPKRCGFFWGGDFWTTLGSLPWARCAKRQGDGLTPLVSLAAWSPDSCGRRGWVVFFLGGKILGPPGRQVSFH